MNIAHVEVCLSMAWPGPINKDEHSACRSLSFGGVAGHSFFARRRFGMGDGERGKYTKHKVCSRAQGPQVRGASTCGDAPVD